MPPTSTPAWVDRAGGGGVSDEQVEFIRAGRSSPDDAASDVRRRARAVNAYQKTCDLASLSEG
jgi:hypothetical protein